MAALGWYYLINGKGVSHRWLKGFGGLFYAVMQHAIFNGSNLLGLIPSVSNLLGGDWHLGTLPIDYETVLFFGYYVIILGVLVVVTGRLAREKSAASGAAVGSAGVPQPQSVAGGRS